MYIFCVCAVFMPHEHVHYKNHNYTFVILLNHFAQSKYRAVFIIDWIQLNFFFFQFTCLIMTLILLLLVGATSKGKEWRMMCPWNEWNSTWWYSELLNFLHYTLDQCVLWGEGVIAVWTICKLYIWVNTCTITI